MWKKLYRKAFGQELDLRERIFRIILLLGSVAAISGNIESMILMGAGSFNVPLAIMLGAMAVSLVATFKYNKIDFAAGVLGFFGIVVVFPQMFFWSGGIRGGATIWFTLVILYVFLMFEGKRLVFFLILSIVVDVVTYWVGFHHPEQIHALSSETAVYADSFFSMLLVGIVSGLILKFQLITFNREREITMSQQNKLEKASNSKNTFFANMSHEIRTPINSIIGWNEMILRQEPEGELKEYAENVQNASEMLLNLVNDILDLSQMEIKKMELVSVEYSPKKIIRDLVNMIQIRLQEKKLDFQVDIDENIPSTLLGDEKRIKQVILNLLTNAVKYTDTGFVRLSVVVEEKKQDRVKLKISVADSGIGIRKEDLDLLYDVFRRVDTERNRRVEGSGLGLSIVKQLLDLMGGEISVDSIYTKGSVFTVTLVQTIVNARPIGKNNFLEGRQKQSGQYYQQSFEAPEARILVVDDNTMNSRIITRLLSATKVQVDVVNSGMECLEKTRQKYYHVILMDHLMPEMDGVETFQALRRQENGLCRDSSVILVTASSLGEAGVVYKENRFDDFLEKPIRGEKLEEKILKFLPEDIIEYRAVAEEYGEEGAIEKISKQKRKRIYITSDCVCDIPEELTEKYDIKIIYLYIKTDKGRFADTREIDSDNLQQYMAGNEIRAHADSVSVEEYEEFFAEALTEADEIIHISMAKNAGKSYGVAELAAKGFDHVHIIDSGQISGGEGLVVLYAAKLAAEGYHVAEIIERVEQVKKQVEICFFMPTAKVFYQHGYMKRFAAVLFDFFRLHPILKMHQSRIYAAGFRLGDIDNARRRFLRFRLFNKLKINNDVVFFTYVGCNVKQLNAMKSELTRRIPFKNVIVQKGSFSSACNCGMGTIGVAYLRGTDKFWKNLELENEKTNEEPLV